MFHARVQLYATLAKSSILAQNIPPQPAWGARTHQLSCLAKAAALRCRLGRHGAATVLHSRLQATHTDREEEGVVDRRASDVADYERDLGPGSGRAGADDRCCAHAAHKRGTHQASEGPNRME